MFRGQIYYSIHGGQNLPSVIFKRVKRKGTEEILTGVNTIQTKLLLFLKFYTVKSSGIKEKTDKNLKKKKAKHFVLKSHDH